MKRLRNGVNHCANTQSNIYQNLKATKFLLIQIIIFNLYNHMIPKDRWGDCSCTDYDRCNCMLTRFQEVNCDHTAWQCMK